MKKFEALVLSSLLAFTFTVSVYAEGAENVDYFIYQGETYYTAQTDNPAADLQPGEQIDVKLSDNTAFTAGTYKITVVSCGNRESVLVKVNGADAGTISRKGTGFGMDQMTSDVLETEVELKPEDTLSFASESGEIYGWVDYIQLDKVGEAADTVAAADIKAADTEAAAPADNNDVPKTGEEFPAYLIPMAVCAAGFIALSKINKKELQKD
jgi:hypothetical protein